MCVSMAPAEFSGTILYGGRRQHPRYGPVEVLGYQNTAVNHATGANAMVLHLPSPALGQEHFVPVGEHRDVLQRMVNALRPPPTAGAFAAVGVAPAVTVFEHDIYTVVLASDPTQIPGALSRVPERKRPALNPELFDFYAKVFPQHSIALCCFDNADAQQASPLLIWYPPRDPSWIVLPAVDCHTGAVPELGAPVRTDHWVIFGSDQTPPAWGSPVYTLDLPPELRDLLPERVIGTQFTGELPNGDFGMAYQDLLRGDPTRTARLVPTH